MRIKTSIGNGMLIKSCRTSTYPDKYFTWAVQDGKVVPLNRHGFWFQDLFNSKEYDGEANAIVTENEKDCGEVHLKLADYLRRR